MGLDTSHNCWHGPYSAFNRFRYSLGYQIGINLDDYDGYGGEKDLASIQHDLQPLFDHSDCDGYIEVEDSKRIVKGLNDVLDKFDDSLQMDFDFKDNIIQFRDGCLDAISNDETIYFH